jgi:hypothetical protein
MSAEPISAGVVDLESDTAVGDLAGFAAATQRDSGCLFLLGLIDSRFGKSGGGEVTRYLGNTAKAASRKPF